MWTRCLINTYTIQLQAKVADAEATELEIDITRSKYIPVATRTQLLFFCTTDMSSIDPMYQYSLEWFIAIFLSSIASAEPSGDHGTLNNYVSIVVILTVVH